MSTGPKASISMAAPNRVSDSESSKTLQVEETKKSKNQEDIITPAPTPSNPDNVTKRDSFKEKQKMFVETTRSDQYFDEESRIEEKVSSPNTFQRPQYQSGGSFKIRKTSPLKEQIISERQLEQSPVLRQALVSFEKEKEVHRTAELRKLKKENESRTNISPKVQARRNPPSKALQRLGVNAQQVQRAVALKRMGITEEDLWHAAPHFESPRQRRRTIEIFDQRYSRKIVKILGMSEEQILRKKALQVLGTTEAEYQRHRSLSLSALGEEFNNGNKQRKKSLTLKGLSFRKTSSASDEVGCLPIKK